MCQLVVLRHAKSDWDADYGHDHERPLAPRGEAAARLLGLFLTRVGSVPDLALTSSAVRARATVELAAEAGGWESCQLKPTKVLYEASSSAALRQLRRLGARSGIVLLSGHEPCCSELVSRLVGGAEVRMPTAAAARIDLAIESWVDVSSSPTGVLRWLVTPKLLKRFESP